MTKHSAENDALPVGPVVRDACDVYHCGRPRSEHRTGFMDMRDGVIHHDYKQPVPEPYDHERVPAMVTTEWRCHACGADNDVWGTGATESYMECGSCGAHSWLDFNPDAYLDGATSPIPPGCCGICGGPLAETGTSRCYEAHGVIPPAETKEPR